MNKGKMEVDNDEIKHIISSVDYHDNKNNISITEFIAATVDI